MALTQAEYQGIIGKKPWFVNAAAANDTGDGLTPATPKKVIGSAVALAASGDLISIAPGTYTEAVDGSAKGLHFQGCGKDTILTHNGADTLKLGENSIVEKMTINNTVTVDATAQVGRAISSAKGNITLRDLSITATDTPVKLSSDVASRLLTVERCYVVGLEYGLYLGGCDAIVKDCIIKAKNWRLCESSAIWYAAPQDVAVEIDPYYIGSGGLLVSDSHLFIQRDDPTNLNRIGSCITLESGIAKLNGCSLSGLASAYGVVCGVNWGQSGLIGLAYLDGTSIFMQKTGNGKGYDFYNPYPNDVTDLVPSLSAFGNAVFSLSGQGKISSVHRGHLTTSAVNYLDSHARHYDDQGNVVWEPS